MIAALAGRMTEEIFEPGGVYTKCGVMLEELTPAEARQRNLFAEVDPRAARAATAMDSLNARFGRGTVALA